MNAAPKGANFFPNLEWTWGFGDRFLGEGVFADGEITVGESRQGGSS
jgi:hypothetical protein